MEMHRAELPSPNKNNMTQRQVNVEWMFASLLGIQASFSKMKHLYIAFNTKNNTGF